MQSADDAPPAENVPASQSPAGADSPVVLQYLPAGHCVQAMIVSLSVSSLLVI